MGSINRDGIDFGASGGAWPWLCAYSAPADRRSAGPTSARPKGRAVQHRGSFKTLAGAAPPAPLAAPCHGAAQVDYGE